MLFIVASAGGFYRKPYSSRVLKLHTKKSAKQENLIHSLIAFIEQKIEGRIPDKEEDSS
jgi:hypothetical protein